MPLDDEETARTTILELISAGFLFPGDLITPVDAENLSIGEITEDGEILLNEKIYDNPDQATRAVGDEIAEGWDYWAVLREDVPIPFRELVAKLEDL